MHQIDFSYKHRQRCALIFLFVWRNTQEQPTLFCSRSLPPPSLLPASSIHLPQPLLSPQPASWHYITHHITPWTCCAMAKQGWQCRMLLQSANEHRQLLLTSTGMMAKGWRALGRGHGVVCSSPPHFVMWCPQQPLHCGSWLPTHRPKVLFRSGGRSMASL